MATGATDSSRLLANLMLVADKNFTQSLLIPDHNPPIIEILRSWNWKFEPVMPVTNAPIICNKCREQVGTLQNGLACAVDTYHLNCKQELLEPPWFRTAGFRAIAFAAFGNGNGNGNGNKHSTEMLVHLVITEYLAGGHKQIQSTYRERQLNELSRYRFSKDKTSGATSDKSFAVLSSLDC